MKYTIELEDILEGKSVKDGIARITKAFAHFKPDATIALDRSKSSRYGGTKQVLVITEKETENENT